MKPYHSECIPPRVGDHVVYVDLVRNVKREALVSVVFTELDRPHLTLAMIKPGGGIVFKPQVPHQSASLGSDCYWRYDQRTINRAMTPSGPLSPENRETSADLPVLPVHSPTAPR